MLYTELLKEDTDMATVCLIGMFEVDFWRVVRASFMEKLAFMLGSSNEGNARLQSVGCI